MVIPPEKNTRKEGVSFVQSDFVQPFLIDHSAIRGRLVRLEKTLHTIVTAHDYPLSVAWHLAEQVVLASMLSATLSGEGILTVQSKGYGPVSYIIVDVLGNGVMRGYAKIDPDRKGELTDEKMLLSQVLGRGFLAVTLDPGDSSERYQGIVSLDPESLLESFKGYFHQSQQAEVSLHVTVSAPEGRRKKWHGGGIIVERVPLEGGKDTDTSPEEQADLWQRTQLLMKTLSDKEMLNPEVTPQNLLYRLFNEDGVWVYKLHQFKAGCRCSRHRIKNALRSIALEELISLLDDEGKMMIHCEFCNKKSRFDEADLRKLYEPRAKRASVTKK